jgi:hypothetical protein
VTYDELMKNARFLKMLERVWDECHEVDVHDVANWDLNCNSAVELRIVKAFMKHDPDMQRGMVRFAVCFEQARREFLQQH